MAKPLGYVAPGENMICKIKKVIYGLKQSPRAWFDKFNYSVTKEGFHKCYSDHSLFTRRRSLGSVILAVYVDDILLTGSDVDGIEMARDHLKAQFVIKEMGDLGIFLGLKLLWILQEARLAYPSEC